ncbi:MAG: hypothetical protein GX962_15880, partial [Epulopiscium sp.]|nr:hypothetical protein [Candidatus Epulonipiscium sp.]
LFNPKAEISRQDMMVMVARAMELQNKLEEPRNKEVLDQFQDRGQIASYAEEAITSVVNNGLILGSEGKINPLDKTTRAEAATLIYRIYNK